VDIHPAIQQMTRVVNASSTCPIEHYLGDLIHDGYALSKNKGSDPFVWFIRTMGTHIAWDTEFFHAVKDSGKIEAAYHWDGKELHKLEDLDTSPL